MSTRPSEAIKRSGHNARQSIPTSRKKVGDERRAYPLSFDGVPIPRHRPEARRRVVAVSADLTDNCNDRSASLCGRTRAVVNYRSGSIPGERTVAS